jgi:glycosyltransferase involved in cell wall biosynthesis
MKVLHIITDLDTGGAEMMLFKLMQGLDRDRFAPMVVSLTDIGAVGERILSLGVPVTSLGMARGCVKSGDLRRLVNLLREEQPEVVQTWMYHADLLGGLAARLAGVPVAWGIRQSNLDPAGTKRRTVGVARLCALLSRLVPARIVCGSEAAQRTHVALGYDERRCIVIPNGFDLDAFRPDPTARASVRSELGLAADSALIGLIARFDPQKDHGNFIRAAALLHQARPDAHFLLAGEGAASANDTLTSWIETAGLTNHCHLLGRRHDIPRLTAALDVATSSSFGEGFPNVVGEAMACGVPCVVTDVGDSAIIVGETSMVVPPRNAEALASAWLAVLSLTPEARQELGAAARSRVERHYGLAAVVRQYQTLYMDLARG